MSRLSAFGEQEGFAVRVESDTVVAEGVPCLLRNRIVSTCKIEKSFDPENGKPDERIGGAVHAVRVTTDEECDGLVYQADGTPIGSQINTDGRSWSDISIKRGSQTSPEEDASPEDLVHRYAKQIIGAVSAAGYHEPAYLKALNPFRISNTFEARSQIGPVQDRIREMRIAIIGSGGTGAYILDLIAKTPVAEIHLLDSDDLDWHNLMRAPGAPTAEEIGAIEESKSQTREPLAKVAYYHSKYDPLREGIFPHNLRVDSPSVFAEFLSAHPIDFAFVCIDQLPDTDRPRQDAVYNALTEAGVPFIDSGVSITLENSAIRGSITTSGYSEGSPEWQGAIPNAAVQGDIPGYRNVQLPEVNAMAASLAVMEWRRRTGQYVSESPSFLHRFLLEAPKIVTPR